MSVDDERVMPLTREICAELADRGWLTMAWPEPRTPGGKVDKRALAASRRPA